MAESSDDERGDAWTASLRSRLDELLDEYRASLHGALEGLTEEEAKLRLVPSSTTLLGLVKHVTYVEGVWFDQAISGRSYADIGIPTTPARSFAVTADETIAVGASRSSPALRPVATHDGRPEPRRRGRGPRPTLRVGAAAAGPARAGAARWPCRHPPRTGPRPTSRSTVGGPMTQPATTGRRRDRRRPTAADRRTRHDGGTRTTAAPAASPRERPRRRTDRRRA